MNETKTENSVKSSAKGQTMKPLNLNSVASARRVKEEETERALLSKQSNITEEFKKDI